MKDPNPPGSGKDTAKGKGVRREAESEESRIAELRRAPMGKAPARRTGITYKASNEGKAAGQVEAQKLHGIVWGRCSG